MLDTKLQQHKATGEEEYRNSQWYSTCAKCNAEIHGDYVWDEDRGDVWCGWFSEYQKNGKRYFRTTCEN
jgi:hypothetical protein